VCFKPCLVKVRVLGLLLANERNCCGDAHAHSTPHRRLVTAIGLLEGYMKKGQRVFDRGTESVI